jgi:hypothetical protein
MYIQFGFDGGDEWQWRRNELFIILHSNPKAKFVTRAVQFGSEPLFDQVIDPYELASEVNNAKANLAPLGIPVTVSDFAYSYQRVSLYAFREFVVDDRSRTGITEQSKCWRIST